MKLEFTHLAEADLDHVFADGVAKFGHSAADAYLRALTRSLWRLLDFPRSNPVLAELEGHVRIHRFRAHLIIYRVSDHTLSILRVRHAREDWRSFGSGSGPLHLSEAPLSASGNTAHSPA